MSHIDAYASAQRAALARDLRRQTEAAANTAPATGNYGDAGPPTWNRASWEAFKNQYGFYPYGFQEGTYVNPPSFENAPEWVYELMGQRKPPIEVVPPPA